MPMITFGDQVEADVEEDMCEEAEEQLEDATVTALEEDVIPALARSSETTIQMPGILSADLHEEEQQLEAPLTRQSEAAMVDLEGIPGFQQVQRITSCLMTLLERCQAEERRALTMVEAEDLSALIQALDAYDRVSRFAPRAKKAKDSGRFRRKKGEGNTEAETCAK